MTATTTISPPDHDREQARLDLEDSQQRWTKLGQLIAEAERLNVLHVEAQAQASAAKAALRAAIKDRDEFMVAQFRPLPLFDRAPGPPPAASNGEVSAPEPATPLPANPVDRQPEDLAGLFVSPESVKAAYCADKLAAAANKPKGKPASVTPVLVEGTPHVCTGWGGPRVGRQDAWLIPLIRLVSWEGAFMTPRQPSHEVQPDEKPETAYRGRLVSVKGEKYVMEGRQAERKVFWIVEEKKRPDPTDPVAPASGAAPSPHPAATSAAMSTSTPTTGGPERSDPRSPAAERICEVCGVSEHCRAFALHPVARCVNCHGMAGPTTSTFMAGAPAVHCKIRWWTNKAGDVVARATRGYLGNWHEEIPDSSHNPTSEQIVERLSALLGRRFLGLEVCELEDDARTLVLELETVPPETDAGAEELCLDMVCPACGRQAKTRERNHKQLVCSCAGFPRMRRKDSPLSGEPPEYTRPQDVVPLPPITPPAAPQQPQPVAPAGICGSLGPDGTRCDSPRGHPGGHTWRPAPAAAPMSPDGPCLSCGKTARVYYEGPEGTVCSECRPDIVFGAARKKVFSTGEVAKICQVAPRTVSKWFDSGKLKGYKIPGSNDRRIPREQLIRFMKDNGMDLPVELQDAPAAVLPGDGTLFGADVPTATGGGL